MAEPPPSPTSPADGSQPSSVPSVPSANTAPPPDSASPSVSLPVPPSGSPAGGQADLSALSPFAILRKKSESPTLNSREDQLKNVAQVPEGSFILPTPVTPPLPPPDANQTQVIIEKPKPIEATGQRPIGPTGPLSVMESASDPTDETFLLAKRQSQPVAPPQPGKNTFPPPPPPPKIPPVKPESAKLPSPPPPPAPPTAPHHSRIRAIVFASLGLIIGLGALGLGGFALVKSGGRVPLLYTYLSHLQTQGTAVSQQGVAFVQDKGSYQQIGEVDVRIKSGTTKSSLPDSGAPSATVTPVSTLRTVSTAATPLTYSLKSTSLIGRESFTANTGTELPIYLDAAGPSWLIYLPSNAITPLVSIQEASLHKSLLYPVLSPIPLADLLKAAHKESGYDQISHAGELVAHYHYLFDQGSLSAFLPAGASFSSVTGEVWYRWQTAEPVQATLSGTFSYRGTSYEFSQSELYSGWGSNVSIGSDANLRRVLDPTSAGQAAPVELGEFVSQLGLNGLAAVPNSLGDTTPTPTPSPQTTPAPPITPTGEGITQVLPEITATPPLPAIPATEEAKQRDQQRLADLSDLAQAVERYKEKKGSYPISSLDQTRSSQTLLSALVPAYITKLPVDPLNDTYWYEYQSDGKSFTLRSVAEDASNPKAIKGTAYSYFEVTKGVQ